MSLRGGSTICIATLCRERPKGTAARECYEETLGVLGDKQSLTELLTNYEDNNSFKVMVKVYTLRQFLVYVIHF